MQLLNREKERHQRRGGGGAGSDGHFDKHCFSMIMISALEDTCAVVTKPVIPPLSGINLFENQFLLVPPPQVSRYCEKT